MASKKIKVTALCNRGEVVSALVENATGLCYDLKSDAFKAAAPALPMAADPSGLQATLWLTLTSAFVDGDYTVLLCDAMGTPLGADSFSVYKGDSSTPTPDDVAMRVANIQVGGGKPYLRDAISDLQAQVTALTGAVAQVLALLRAKP